jgi:predicted metal-binding membrane protein
MALMLAVGSMNLAWTAALAVVMLAEKVLPAGRGVARIVGVALICSAVVLAGTWISGFR